jgi:F-type H+-transporting ATPase subunit a
MFNLLRQFAQSDIHISLKAEPITQIGPITITNSMIYGLIISTLITVGFVYVAKKITFKPKKNAFYGMIESMVEFLINLMQGPFGSREKAAKYAPIFGTFFVFIFFTNLTGVLPVVGTAVTSGDVPLFRPFTADLNGTIAISVFAILAIQVLSIKEQGLKGHLKHYFSDKPFNPISMFIGLLEVFGELTRIISLSLRLFLNTAVGEILIAVFTSMILANGRTPLAVIPILMFEVLVAGIQAYVFTILTATYLGLAIMHADHGDTHEVHHAPDAIKTKVETVSA